MFITMEYYLYLYIVHTLFTIFSNIMGPVIHAMIGMCCYCGRCLIIMYMVGAYISMLMYSIRIPQGVSAVFIWLPCYLLAQLSVLYIYTSV